MKEEKLEQRTTEETPIEFIERRFLTADNTIIYDEQFKGYLERYFSKQSEHQIWNAAIDEVIKNVRILPNYSQANDDPEDRRHQIDTQSILKLKK